MREVLSPKRSSLSRQGLMRAQSAARRQRSGCCGHRALKVAAGFLDSPGPASDSGLQLGGLAGSEHEWGRALYAPCRLAFRSGPARRGHRKPGRRSSLHGESDGAGVKGAQGVVPSLRAGSFSAQDRLRASRRHPFGFASWGGDRPRRAIAGAGDPPQHQNRGERFRATADRRSSKSAAWSDRQNVSQTTRARHRVRL